MYQSFVQKYYPKISEVVDEKKESIDKVLVEDEIKDMISDFEKIKINTEIQESVTLASELRTAIDRIIAELEGV